MADSKKTKFEKKDSTMTSASFTFDEIRSFALQGYSQQRRDLYLEKVAARPQNPRMVDGLEVLSDVSMVLDVDMTPLSSRQDMARFDDFSSYLEPDSNPDDQDDESFYSADRADNPPSPHELRAIRLEKRIDAQVKAYNDKIAERLEGGDTPLPDGDPNPPKMLPKPNATSSKEDVSLPSKS